MKVILAILLLLAAPAAAQIPPEALGIPDADHPAKRASEILIGNVEKTDVAASGWKTARTEGRAFDVRGRRLPRNIVPLFVERAEVEAAGIPISAKKAIPGRIAP